MLFLGLSLFDTGLMVTIIVLLVLYLIVLIRLKPSTHSKEHPKTNLSTKKMPEKLSTKPQSNPQLYKPQEQTVEKAEPTQRTEPVERPEPTPPPSINIAERLSMGWQSDSQVYDEPPVESVKKMEPTQRAESVEKPEPAPPPPTETAVAKGNNNLGCPHHFGYLKEHPKKTPIPNECLTCIKIMECLMGVE